MRAESKVHQSHLEKRAYIYVRQSSAGQVVNHPESARRQRELVKLAEALGWPGSRIVVLDEDQGKTGQVAAGREAYKRLLGDVSVGEVGMVVGLEVSRLARNMADWFPLLEMCALTETLIADEEGVYDPKDPNDRLVLGLKGTLSEAELHLIRARLLGARWSLARRGELRRKIPSGYAWDEHDHVVLEPDARVRSAIQGFFNRFQEIGSAYGVTQSYSRHGLLFPRREFRDRWDGPVRWGRLSVRLANRILHNPFYAGAYFYGRRRAVTTLDPATRTRKTVMQKLPLESWEVLIHDAHPAYISWGEFAGNQGRLKENWCMPSGGAGSARSGNTLLQGIVHCGRCGRQMSVRYWGRDAHPAYICTKQMATATQVYCSSVPAGRVDRWVEERILEVIQPVGIEAALAAVDELEKQSEDLRRQWKQRIEQAEYEAGLARRRYEAVDPDNRLVVANLERDWEEKLREVEALRKEYEQRAATPPMRLGEQERRRLHDLARDLPRLWRAKTTKSSDRKRVLRLLLRDVWLTQQDAPRRTRIQLHWQTGAVSEGEVERAWPIGRRFKTPDRVVQRLLELAESRTPAEIADALNREDLMTGRGLRFNASRVRNLLSRQNSRRSGQEAQGPEC